MQARQRAAINNENIYANRDAPDAGCIGIGSRPGRALHRPQQSRAEEPRAGFERSIEGDFTAARRGDAVEWSDGIDHGKSSVADDFSSAQHQWRGSALRTCEYAGPGEYHGPDVETGHQDQKQCPDCRAGCFAGRGNLCRVRVRLILHRDECFGAQRQLRSMVRSGDRRFVEPELSGGRTGPAQAENESAVAPATRQSELPFAGKIQSCRLRFSSRGNRFGDE